MVIIVAYAITEHGLISYNHRSSCFIAELSIKESHYLDSKWDSAKAGSSLGLIFPEIIVAPISVFSGCHARQLSFSGEHEDLSNPGC